MPTDEYDNFYNNVEFNRWELDRIKETVLCKDSELIPKVADAGKIYFDKKYNKFVQIMHNGLKILTDSHYGIFNVEIIRM